MPSPDHHIHETWLGMVQPDGLVVSVPVLVDAQCARRLPLEVHRRFLELCPPRDPRHRGPGDPPRAIGDLAELFAGLLELTPDLYDSGDGLPDELALWVPEGRQTLRPTFALRRPEALADGAAATDQDGPAENAAEPPKSLLDANGETPASRAGSAYQLLIWDLPESPSGGLPLDKPETTTGPWEYPPAAKFERLLRHTRVPIGLLSNRRELRLIYAPHGESSGAITFRVDDMATVGGRPILDALVMLLSAHRLYGALPEHRLPALLRQSRERQADVTNELARQVLEALEILLRGFEAAAERDGSDLLEDALARDDDHLYGGLLTVLLRLVFVLYAEDRDLLPVEHPLYQRHLSLLALFDELQTGLGEHPDSMARRFGAWGRLIALFRAIHYGAHWSAPQARADVSAERPESLRGTAPSGSGEDVSAETSSETPAARPAAAATLAPSPDLVLPARGGSLFDPNAYPFLEGWGPGGSAPVHVPEERARVRVPSVDDETVYRVLEKLLVLEGQRLSYRALDVEQIGSVYEALMGYHVRRVASTAACLGPSRVWMERAELEELPKSRRPKWIKERTGLTKARSDELAAAVTEALTEAPGGGAAPGPVASGAEPPGEPEPADRVLAEHR
ncbi:MAG TPA: hypothetical protein VMS76_10805, partial [Planctomycetota bacterium]|nr:hypothetical protein [Planctomycetota bacterium]